MLHFQEMVRRIEEKFPRRKKLVGLEIGCNRGEFSAYVLWHVPKIISYHAVDMWSADICNDYMEDNEIAERAYQCFLAVTDNFEDKILIHRGPSEEMLRECPDKHFDFIFIDGNHRYEFVKKDIQLSLPLLKKGGLLGGHDFVHCDYTGVPRAVEEMLPGKFEVGPSTTWWHNV